METIDYTIEIEDNISDEIPQPIIDIVSNQNIGEELEYSTVKVRHVESPFLLADNEFDMREANNDLFESGVEKTKLTQFTGGAVIVEYIKKDDLSFIVHGNEEEGYNIFILE